MKKPLTYQILYYTIIVFFFFSCEQKNQYLSFNDWFKDYQIVMNKEKANPTNSFSFVRKNLNHRLVIESDVFNVDTIYRSMHGPYSTKNVSIEQNSDDFLWITSYSSKVINGDTKQPLSQKYICYNKLNLVYKFTPPWKIKTKGVTPRLFMLTKEQTAVHFPDGFGIPIPPNQKIEMVSQILSNHVPEKNTNVMFKAEIEYLKQSELETPLTPLYQQTIFVTKKTTGHTGKYGHPFSCTEKEEFDNERDATNEPDIDCTTDYGNKEYNPFLDIHDRTYSNLWEINSSKEVLTTDVTKMMDLQFDTKIHFISIHLHPFATSLLLKDATTNSILFRVNVKNDTNGINIEKMQFYSSKKGISVYKNHRYELTSIYECSDTTTTHSAMASMMLYLHDKQ